MLNMWMMMMMMMNIFKKERTDFDANWHKLSVEQWREMVNFWGSGGQRSRSQEVKVQGHRYFQIG